MRRRPYITERQRQDVAERAEQRCEYCQLPRDYSPGSMSVDHVQPVAQGGSTELANLAFACQGCNSEKRAYTQAMDADTSAMTPLYNPRIHLWADHFAWRENGSLIIGLTPVGRVTVARLDMNRVGMINARRGMMALGEHPLNDATSDTTANT